jgi:hypothetical protein
MQTYLPSAPLLAPAALIKCLVTSTVVWMIANGTATEARAWQAKDEKLITRSESLLQQKVCFCKEVL